MRSFFVALLLVFATFAVAAPVGSGATRGVVYSKVTESEEENEAAGNDPPVGGLYILRGRHPRRVTYDPADVEPAVSRTGAIAFVRGGDIYLVRPDGTGLRQLTDGPGLDERPLFAPDGLSLAFTRRSAAGNPRDLYLIGLDGSGLTALAATAADQSEPAFAPDGAAVSFVSDGDIYTVKPGAGQPRRLTDTSVRESSPHYFAGGLLFDRAATSGARSAAIYRMRRDGNKVAAVVAKRTGARIAGVTPDGDLLVFINRGSFWNQRLSGERFVPKRLSGIYGRGRLAISPDGRRGAFLLYFDEDFAIEILDLLNGGFYLSADLYRLGDGIAIDSRLAW